jgi:hypothetical protein
VQYFGRKTKRRDAGDHTGVALNLPENLRNALKNPLGMLVQEKDVTKENILEFLSSDTYLVTVGDATTEKMLGFGLTPSLQIVDGLEKRAKRVLPQNKLEKNLSCDNPAGQITTQSIDVIRQAMSLTPPVRITVNGEEDLLAIPVCIYAPNNTVVLYGQPNEGLVVITVTDEIRNKTKEILSLMK